MKEQALRKRRAAPAGGGVSGRAAWHPLPSRPAPRVGWKLLVWTTAALHPRCCPGGSESPGSWEPHPTPLLTPASGSVPQAPGPPPLPWAVGRMLVQEGRKEGRQAGSEALRGHGQGWVMGRQAQEVSPWPAIWPVTSPGAWRCFSLKLCSRLLPPRPRASLLPTPHCLLCSLVLQAWRKHLLCPGSQEAGLQAHGGTAGRAPGGRRSQQGRAPWRGRGTGCSADRAGSVLCLQSKLLPHALGPGAGTPSGP